MKKASTSTAPSLVHEKNQVNQHRIVQIRNGIPKASPWFEAHQIAVFGQYRAVVFGGEALPSGIFRVNPVAHESL